MFHPLVVSSATAVDTATVAALVAILIGMVKFAIPSGPNHTNEVRLLSVLVAVGVTVAAAFLPPSLFQLLAAGITIGAGTTYGAAVVQAVPSKLPTITVSKTAPAGVATAGAAPRATEAPAA